MMGIRHLFVTDVNKIGGGETPVCTGASRPDRADKFLVGRKEHARYCVYDVMCPCEQPLG
jgi:hypothetical protein